MSLGAFTNIDIPFVSVSSPCQGLGDPKSNATNVFCYCFIKCSAFCIEQRVEELRRICASESSKGRTCCFPL